MNQPQSVALQGDSAATRKGASHVRASHYTNAEIDKVVIGVFAFLVFVMVALTRFPEFVALGGGPGPAEVGNLIKMIQ